MDGYNVENHITQDEFGIYHWTGTIDRGYEDKTFKITFSVCGGICALLILMSSLLAGRFPESFFCHLSASWLFAAAFAGFSTEMPVTGNRVIS
ncbi:MAG: hypothetical protein K6E42_03870 [Synergistes sp.]|nr:hypothetical protein [Synergistes sp.]